VADGGDIDEDRTADALRTFLYERLASYKQPRHLWFVDALPMTPVPKVDKVALAADARGRLGLSGP
jgi:acyl-CoA synthetase (AMP-forming)/AMP-acid ligase II